MTDEHTIRLTRRRALGGLAAVGVASAGAGIGTTAYFSDREEFDGNTITAGEFGLTVEQHIATVDQGGMGPDEDDFDEDDFDGGVNDDGVWVTKPIDIEDAKPGDKYEFCWEITVEENPGYVAVVGDSTDENGKEAGNIDLDDLWDIDKEKDLKSLGEAADATLTTTTSDGEEYTGEYDSLGSLLDSLEGGILVSKGEGDVIQFDDGETVKVCLKIEIPTGVGNAIQGAVTETDMTFYAEQARHNDPDDVKANAAGD